ncbi:hypothetical protein AAFF_G00305780 [Aldrovandia affinis]|uniref:Uncharacterized protein n=1 Tax=Aldrovandia affinis TaxID=143900 RepID=A0AAD7WR97_9TELE|nr:hypothetical protein AAFF_G00305780 [Aldrovandia affinis]
MVAVSPQHRSKVACVLIGVKLRTSCRAEQRHNAHAWLCCDWLLGVGLEVNSVAGVGWEEAVSQAGRQRRKTTRRQTGSQYRSPGDTIMACSSTSDVIQMQSHLFVTDRH